tara:strand:- start:79 stop:1965 length:1887 start_codon:yes stop_codon:yes gene_type:complete
MIRIHYEGRHGNMIFQYIFARYISFLTGQYIECEDNYYKYTNNSFLKFTPNLCKRKDTNSESNSIEEIVITDNIAEEIIDKLLIDNKYLSNKIIVIGRRNGYYQNSALYKHHNEFIKSILVYPSTLPEILENKSVLIHIRLDDFHRNGHDSEILHLHYYDHIIKKYNYTDIHIICQRNDNSSYKKRMIRDAGNDYIKEEILFLEYFKATYGAKISNHYCGVDFKRFQNFTNIILSASSFGLWGAVNVKHKCIIHIPTHILCNATHKTSDILRWCGHEVIEYKSVKFVNFNERQFEVAHVFPSCEGYVTEKIYPTKSKKLYLAHFANTAGFFSNCSMGLYSLVRYHNCTNTVPNEIDMSLLFQMYKNNNVIDYSNNETSLCKLLVIDKCICKNCQPLLEEKKWSCRYSNSCHKKWKHHINIGPRYFDEYHSLCSKFQNSNFKHWSQFHPYTKALINGVKPFVEAAFTPSKHIQTMVKNIEIKYNIDYTNTCVLFFRGGDKATETKLPNYHEYISEVKKNHPDGKLTYLIQSDEKEFIEAMCSAFENYIYLKDEIRTISRQKKGQVDNDCEEDNFIFTQKFLAITIIMSKCKYVYCNTGNCSLWIRLYRTLNEGFHQWIYWDGKPIWYIE